MVSLAAERPMSTVRTMFVVGPLSVFGPLSIDLYLPSLPELAGDLGATDSQAQLTMSACMLGLGVGQLVAGSLSDRLGRRRPILVGVALFALLSLACALAPTIELLLAVRFLQGMAGAAGMVVSMATIRDMFAGAELSRYMSLQALVTAAAPILAPVLGGQLARVMDWRGIFGVLAGMGVALLALAAIGLKETLPAEHRGAHRPKTTRRRFVAVMKDRQFLLVTITTACTSTGFFAYLSMSSFIFQREYSLSAAGFSMLFAANSVAILLGSQLSGFIVRRVGPRRMYLAAVAIGLAAAGLLLAVAGAGVAVGTFAVTLSIMLFASGLSGPNATTIALHHHGARAGTASSLYGFVMFSVGPVVVPLVSTIGITAVTLGAVMFAGYAIACSLAWTLLRRQLIRGGL